MENNTAFVNPQQQAAQNQMPSEENRALLHQQIEELQKKCEEYLSGWQRAKADYSNREKDMAREKAEFVKFANEAFLLELIPVFDNFREALSHIPNDHKTYGWVIGIELVKKRTHDFLKNFGVEPYGKEGDLFDPNRFEALDEVEGEEDKKGKIVKVVRMGYMLGGRVIRPGQAVVGK